MNLAALLGGLGLGASLIIAIGAQNAFVLYQGIRRQNVLAVVLICTFGDIMLISLGVGGLGSLISKSAPLMLIATWGGAAYLLYFGVTSFRSAFRSESLSPGQPDNQPAQRSVMIKALAVTLLNPHVYLDTVVLLGSVSVQFAPHRLSFALGAMTASVIWFFSLGFIARLLTPLFRRPVTWKVLDILIGLIMVTLAVLLIFSGLDDG